MRCLVPVAVLCGTLLLVVGGVPAFWNPPSPAFNWTTEFDRKLAEFALDFASASYSTDPEPCLDKHGAHLIKRVQLSCDYVRDECWALLARSEDWIVFAVRGTKTKLQLITELVETMSAPKKRFPAGGSVQRYFFAALNALWHANFGRLLRQEKQKCPKCRILFTGHSLGGALASLASSLFAHENRDIAEPAELFLITFGQPRVGNQDYAKSHDALVPNSWRLIHRYDIVAHLPYCYESIFSRRCSPGYNHGPFHHGTEIWYPDDMNADSIFKICTGEPTNEDNKCSNGYYIHFGITDHLFYLGKDVSAYGTNGCQEPSRKRLIETNRTKNKKENLN